MWPIPNFCLPRARRATRWVRSSSSTRFKPVSVARGRFLRVSSTPVSCPTFLCLAKSIAGGLPLGATVVRSGISLELGTHGSTFGGNPIACAVARATLDVLLNSDLINRVEGIGDLICRPTRELEPGIVREIRQVGLMIGIQLKKPIRPYVRAIQERGVLVLSAGKSVLRLLPPLVLSAGEASEVGAILADVLSAPPPSDP